MQTVSVSFNLLLIEETSSHMDKHKKIPPWSWFSPALEYSPLEWTWLALVHS